jgi:Na+-driven multidrug efflux pump
MAMRIMKLGIPSGITQAIMATAGMVVQTLTNTMGETVIACNVIVMRVDGFAMLPNMTFGQAMSVYTGQNVGAGKYDRVRKGIKDTMWMATITSVAICSVLFTFAEFFFSLFTPDQAVIQIGARMVHFLMPTYITYIGIEILSGGLRAMGDTFVPMLLSCGGVCGIRFFWTLFVCPLYPTIEMLELNFPVSWVTTLLMFVIYYYIKRKKLMPDLA